MVIAVALPLRELLGEQLCVVNDPAHEQLIEPLGVDSVRTSQPPVEQGCAGFGVPMAGGLVEDVPVQRRAELLTIGGLYTIPGEGRLGQNVVDELDDGLLVVARIGR